MKAAKRVWDVRAWGLLWLLLLAAMTPGAASAKAVDLYPTVCSAALPDGASDAGIVEAPYRCGAEAPTRGRTGCGCGWTRPDWAACPPTGIC
ncbi:hypothetical protein [Sphingomonas sp. LK11]|uniref:hypothetical protein n=1 Tax=Sphingomonas sp. LK11 TaxID=1390395 RepID=UPI0015605EBD|nr:hypothetical protein [Sphingomonas sp. LK11]